MDLARVKLKWNNHQSVFRHYLQEYCDQPRFSDAMIACQSRLFMVHRIILSTCSDYFEEIFRKAPNDNTRPIIVLNDVTEQIIEWILAYMYCGEVTIPQDSLPLLFRTAEHLKIKGLLHLFHQLNNQSVPGSIPETSPASDTETQSNPSRPQKRKSSSTSSNVQSKRSTPVPSESPVVPKGSPVQKKKFSPPPTPFLPPPPPPPPPPAPTLIVDNPVANSGIRGSRASSEAYVSPSVVSTASSKRSSKARVPNTNPLDTIASIALSALPMEVQSQVMSSLPMEVQSQVMSPGAEMTTLANHLGNQSRKTSMPTNGPQVAPLSNYSLKKLHSSESPAVAMQSISSEESESTKDAHTDYPLLMEIKEEIKEEPLMLGPDDPLSMDEEVDDDDDSFWGRDDETITPPPPEDTVSKSKPASNHMVVLPTPVCMAWQQTEGKQSIVDSTAGGSVGLPARSTHVLPQVISKPTCTAKIRVKDSLFRPKEKVQQDTNPNRDRPEQQQMTRQKQCHKQLPNSKEAPKTQESPSAVQDRKYISASMAPKKGDHPLKIKVLTTKAMKMDGENGPGKTLQKMDRENGPGKTLQLIIPKQPVSPVVTVASSSPIKSPISIKSSMTGHNVNESPGPLQSSVGDSLYGQRALSVHTIRQAPVGAPAYSKHPLKITSPPLRPTPLTITAPPGKDHLEQVSSIEDDPALGEMMEMIQEVDILPGFFAVRSEKKRNQPYLIHSSKIATRNDEPVRFCLRGAKPYQIVTICMRYTEEKFRGYPVIPCKLHQKEGQRFNFQVSVLNICPVMYREEEGHPTAHIVIGPDHFDEENTFNFFVSFICLNSCHKGTSKKMEIIFKLLDPSDSNVLKEKHFDVRVCKNVKRDYKDSICEEQRKGLRLSQLLAQSDASMYTDAGGVSENNITMESIGLSQIIDQLPLEVDTHATEEASPKSERKSSEQSKDDFLLLRLPNSEHGKKLMDMVKVFEKTIMDLNPSGIQQESSDLSDQ